jgi:transitional endoplasmic reticulum ATPase
MALLYEQYLEHCRAAQAALAARQPAEARPHLLQAGRLLLQLALETSQPDRRASHKQRGLRLLEMARRIPVGSESRSAPVPGSLSYDPPLAETTADSNQPWEVVDKPGVRFDDIAGLGEVKELIRRRVILPCLNPELARQYRRRPGGGILMYGPPGTGKTMMAKAIATELNATFFSVRASDVMSKWVGEAEQNFKALFDAARARPLAVVFLDETEALVGRRGGQSTVMNRVIPEFLAQVDGLGTASGSLLLLGATNRPWDIDPAALRPGRFGERVYVGLPDAPARRAILAATLGRVPCQADVDFSQLATRTEGYSGADLNGLVDRIVDPVFEQAMQSSRTIPVEQADVDRGLSHSRRSVTPQELARYEKFRSEGQ